MNFPKAKRLRLCLAIAAVAAFAVILPAAANADFKAGTGVTLSFANPTPGAHSDITVKHTYTYNGVPSGVAANTGDDLKQWILDTPAGFVGNPNAIPYDERCTVAQAATYVKSTPMPPAANGCPASSIVGSAKLTLGVDASGATGGVLNGTIYEVQSAPPLQEVPTTLMTIFPTIIPAFPLTPLVGAKSSTQIAPVTSGPQGNFQLRSVSDGPIDRPDLSAALNQAPGTTVGHIKNIEQTLLGVLPNGNAFQTNPTRCDAWDTTLYSATYGTPAAGGGTASQTTTLSGTADGGGDSSGSYAPFAAPSTIPDCGTLAPFVATTTSSLSEFKRDSNPALTITTSNPGAPGADVPKTITGTLPASVTTDLQSPALQAGVLCEVAQADAGACPAGSKIGSVAIETPMLLAGLSGDVYAVRGSTTVPDLRVYVTGALTFQMTGTSTFVGPRKNQISTTFTNLPQTPFTKFTLTINGSTKGQPDSLLTISKCPSNGKSPEDSPFVYDESSWGGQSAQNTYTAPLANCFTVSKLPKQKKCVKSTLKVKPTVQSTALLQKSELYIKNGKKYKRVKVYKKYPSNKTLSFRMGSKVKKGKTYRYQVKFIYKKTAATPTKYTVKKATSSFKRCK